MMQGQQNVKKYTISVSDWHRLTTVHNIILESQQASEQQPIGGTAFHVPVEGPARTDA